MYKITYEQVKLFIETNSLKFNPSQKKVSYPIILRIHKRLQEGHRFGTIKVHNNTINDGHHRFICLSLLNMEIRHDIAGENITKQAKLTWKDVMLDFTDYDSEKEKEEYIKKYDKSL